jgi:hypothetical protein
MMVTIYHNISRDASFGLNEVFVDSGKRQAVTTDERHVLVKVFEYNEPEPVGGDILNDAFSWFNENGKGDAVGRAYRALRLRSLSVGDVIAIEDGDAFSVERFGFQVRLPDELRIETDLAVADTLIRERYGFEVGEQLTHTVPLV